MFVICESRTMNEDSICKQKLDLMMQKFKMFQRKYGRDPMNASNNNSNHKNDSIISEKAINVNNVREINDGVESFLEEIYAKSEILRAYDENVNKSNTDTSATEISNSFYCPGLKKNIMYTYFHIFSWTNLMVKAFDLPNECASSALIEEYFKDLKSKRTML